ncbi:TPA: hypothetical protein ACQN7J_000610 [Streptococcus pyogenes]|uniref:Phage protein n=5 Tax=Bacteria TaxID=2 RepID=A0A088F7B9_STRPY|nr:hypothetical protein [Streptococcus pyogenes]ERL16438.1 hypothetical protein HMPREF1227_0561 [Streptococcus pyogenes GA41046]KKC19377.1 hypothetical protein WH80_06985 [Streptococcus dysgalactiae subsp. equisimilis]QBX07741.1 hypothetical protein JavanS171_0022 [Streptococcus satellite phage Javan171]QBX10717.1 hypothetical protein JavanS469_0024 [Streptococcus satellite phage Javan469]QBX10813.1 hypothetical protein JavanS480_0023 [Streptococcus satellite phage Javan480]HEP6168308.1 hypot
MKKKLVLATLCLSMCAVSVRADEETTQNKFILDGPQQKVPEVTVSNFFVGDKEVKVYIPKGWWVRLYRNTDPYSKNWGTLAEQPDLPTTNSRPSYMTDPYRQYYDNTPYTISLKDSPLKKGERLTFSFTGDDGFYAGSAFYRDSLSIKEDKEYDEEIKKIEEELEKRDQEDDALKSFKQQQQEEANKTWYQRVGDSFQDQWWNFKDWLRG